MKKILIIAMYTITILLSDSILDSHYEYVNYTLKTNWIILKTVRVYETTH